MTPSFWVTAFEHYITISASDKGTEKETTPQSGLHRRRVLRQLLLLVIAYITAEMGTAKAIE